MNTSPAVLARSGAPLRLAEAPATSACPMPSQEPESHLSGAQQA